MSKRVNIAYTVKFDEVPKFVKNLLQEKHNLLYKELDKKFSDLLNLLSKENEKAAIEIIEEIREGLVDIDFCLNDCASILLGYQKEALRQMDPGTSAENEEVSTNGSGWFNLLPGRNDVNTI